MKNNTSIAILGITLAIVGGMFAANASGLIGFKSTDSKAQAGAYMTGHVETILRDVDGNIKEYRQSDNLISNTGENCVLRLLFQDGANRGAGTGTNVCTGALTAPWDTIALGTGGATAVNGTQAGLTTETSATGMARARATTFSWTSSSTGNSTAQSSTGSASLTLSKTFTNTSGGTVTVSESGLFNSTTISGSGMFARQTFSGIAVNNNDSLTVQWTVNVGGTSYTLQQFS